MSAEALPHGDGRVSSIRARLSCALVLVPVLQGYTIILGGPLEKGMPILGHQWDGHGNAGHQIGRKTWLPGPNSKRQACLWEG